MMDDNPSLLKNGDVGYILVADASPFLDGDCTRGGLLVMFLLGYWIITIPWRKKDED